MSTAMIIIAAAEHLANSASTSASLLVATRGMLCALAPRVSCACALGANLFALVAQSPTAWCTATLRIESLDAAALLLVPATFPQLRRIEVGGSIRASDALRRMFADVCGTGALREIVTGCGVEVSVTTLREMSPVLARLHTLELGNCQGVSSFDVLRGMSGLRVFQIGFSGGLTDDQLAAMLAGSPMLTSLAIEYEPLASGAFLGALPEQCALTLRDIRLVHCTNLKDAGTAHLAELRGLERLDVVSCHGVASLPPLTLPPLRRHAGDNFFAGNSSLTAVDLSCLRNATTVGNGFLLSARALTSLQLASLANVTSIGSRFCFDASSLTTLDLGGLSNVTTVGRYFLYGSGLTALSLAGLHSVTAVGDGFLSHCGTLATVDLSALRNVQVVGDDFMASCRSITTLDVSGLASAISFGGYFASDCTSLTSVDLSMLRSLTAVGNNFLSRTNVREVDLAGMGGVQSIGREFLDCGWSLRSVDASALTHVRAVDDGFLSRCTPSRVRLSDALLCSNGVEEKFKRLHRGVAMTEDAHADDDDVDVSCGGLFD